MTIAVPTFGTVSTAWCQHYSYLQKPLGAVVTSIFDERPSASVAEKRNTCVRHAIENGSKTLLFIGDDVFVPGDIVLRMLDWWRKGYKAVTGVYWTKGAPLQPYIWRGYLEGAYFDWKAGEFFEIDWAGCDCLLLDVEMLKQMPEPWFSLDYNMFPNSHLKENPNAGAAQATTEDLFFYTERLKKAGVKLYCDSSIQCLHEDRATRQRWGLTPDMPQAGAPEPEEQGLLIADIGSSNIPQPLDQKNRVVRFDGDASAKPDYLCDIRKIPAGDAVFDMVNASHCLEHLPVNDLAGALHEWARILKPDGKLKVKVPNLRWSAKKLLDPGRPHPYIIQTVYGRQTSPGEFHYIGFVTETLEELARSCPLIKDIEVTGTQPDEQGFPTELTLTAKRALSLPISTADTFAELTEKQKEQTDETVPHPVPAVDPVGRKPRRARK